MDNQTADQSGEHSAKDLFAAALERLNTKAALQTPEDQRWATCSCWRFERAKSGAISPDELEALKVRCVKCGSPMLNRFNIEENRITGELRLGVVVNEGPCQDCLDSTRRRERDESWQRSMASVFPPLFSGTDPNRLPQYSVGLAMEWTPTTQRPGLLLHGPTGAGKTRIAILTACRLADAGPHTNRHLPVWMPAVTFGHEVFKRFGGGGDGPDWISRLCSSPILVIDDLGKGKLTERVQSELFGLLDHRFTHGATTIISCNVASSGVKEAFDADMAQPLIRRLKEFCLTVGCG